MVTVHRIEKINVYPTSIHVSFSYPQRSDGLVCGALLKHLGLIDEITFVHPKDMQDGKIAIDANDITTNLPYVPGCHLAFDHHLSETVRNVERADNHIINADFRCPRSGVLWRPRSLPRTLG